jgi:aminopeptidase N
MRKKQLYRYSILLFNILLAHAVLKSQPYGCQVFKSAQAPIYYSAENLRSDTFDLLKITINLEIGNSSNPTIKGNAQIRFAPKLNGRTFIRFDLLKLFVDSVKEGNNLRTYAYNDTILKVNFAAPKNTTDTSIFTVYYKGSPIVDATGWGGFYFNNAQSAEYAFNLGVGFDAKPHNYGRVWFPCFDNFVEKNKYEFNITSDNQRKAFCNGTLISDIVNGSNHTRKWVLNEEIPSYLASMALADYTQVNWIVNTLSGSKPITLVANAADTTALKAGFVNLKSCINGFENYYGPYKWNRFGYCVVPFNNGAMEHATNISYPQPFIGNLAYESDLMAHELSHHWWGDLVTCETQEDMWINEGMATFSSYMFLEWQYGKKRYLDKVRSAHDDLLHFLHKKEGGFRAISGVPHSLTYSDHVYLKGADVAHTLRGYMGDSAFFAACKNTMQQKGFKNMNSLDMKLIFQQSTTQNITAFFNNWVFAGGWPHFAVDSVKYNSISAGNVNALVSIRQKLYGANTYYTDVPLEISFFKSDRSRVVRQVLMSGATGTFTVNLPFVPVMYVLNYDSKISDAASHESKTLKTASANTFTLGKALLKIQSAGSDSSLISIVHHYVPPDPFKSNPRNHRLSNQHYWTVDGILAAGFKGGIRFNYDGTKQSSGANTYMDTLLTIVNGDSVGLFYRPNAAFDWTWLRNATKVRNTAKTGYIETDSLLLGEYAFGNLSDTASVDVAKLSGDKNELHIFPNPAKNSVIIEYSEKNLPAELTLTDLSGRVLLRKTCRSKSTRLDVATLPKGVYMVTMSSHTNQRVSKQLVIE